MRKICIVTGTRAEWGLLSGLADILRNDVSVQLQIIATNMHLSEKYGKTIDEIVKAGFAVDFEVPMVDDAAVTTSAETVRAMGREMTGFAEAFAKLQPDVVVILGDRYEMLVAATAAMIFGLPIAHLYGGEVTEGAFDDSIRHAITKLSSLHFTSTEVYRQRVIQLGEDPARVFYVGAIGCDNALRVQRMSRAALERSLEFELTEKCFLVTYHPVTNERGSGLMQIRELLRALDAYPDYRVVITSPNSDVGRDDISSALQQYRDAHLDRVLLVPSLGMVRYLSAIPLMSAVIGNSSSGLVEVPSFHVPTVNVGHRQDGRVLAGSVVSCGNDAEEIIAAIRKVCSPSFVDACRKVENPYEKPGTAEAIGRILVAVDLRTLKMKKFHDLPKDQTHVS